MTAPKLKAFHSVSPQSIFVTLLAASLVSETVINHSQMRRPPFDGLVKPIPVVLFAAGSTACAAWKSILTGLESGKYQAKLAIEKGCVQADPLSDPERYLTPDRVAFVLDDQVVNHGWTGEIDRDGRRYFVVRINPYLASFITLPHELQHLLRGHTSVRWTPCGILANDLLDFEITPFELFGNEWQLPTECILLAAALGLAWIGRAYARNAAAQSVHDGSLSLFSGY